MAKTQITWLSPWRKIRGHDFSTWLKKYQKLSFKIFSDGEEDDNSGDDDDDDDDDDGDEDGWVDVESDDDDDDDNDDDYFDGFWWGWKIEILLELIESCGNPFEIWKFYYKFEFPCLQYGVCL